MKKFLIGGVFSAAVLALALSVTPVFAATPNWNVTGTYQWLVSDTYAHDMVIGTQAVDGTFSGTGGYPAGSSPYAAADQTTETITGQVDGDTITLTTTYVGPYNPGHTVTFTGTIASDGTISGTSPLEWHTTSGFAVAISDEDNNDDDDSTDDESTSEDSEEEETADTATEKDACKKYGWIELGYRNQGQCVSAVNGREDNHGQTLKAERNTEEVDEPTVETTSEIKGHASKKGATHSITRMSGKNKGHK